MKRFKSAVRLLALLIAGTIVGLGIYTWNARSLTGDAVPMPFGYGASVVLSGSMEPTLSVGDLLILQEADVYSEGDLVVYQSGTMAVVHRLVSIDEETAVTRGDANNSDDSPIPVTAIKGKVIGTFPKVGRLIWAVKSPGGILTTIVLAILLTELSFRNEKKEKHRQQEEIKAEIRRLMQELQENPEE